MTTEGQQVVTAQELDAALNSAVVASGATPASPPHPGVGADVSAGSPCMEGAEPTAGEPLSGSAAPAAAPDDETSDHVGEPDFTGVSTVTYAPHPDGLPDPGEVVWTWVSYEEDLTRGKDRPVLVVGRDDDFLLALMLTSHDHDGPGSDQADEERFGRHWLDLGPGAWDTRGRPSQVRLDRVLRVDPAGVRREGATLEPDRFDLVAQRLREAQGWS